MKTPQKLKQHHELPIPEIANKKALPKLEELINDIQYQNARTNEHLNEISEKLYAIHRCSDKDPDDSERKEVNESVTAIEFLTDEMHRMLIHNRMLQDIKLHLSTII